MSLYVRKNYVKWQSHQAVPLVEGLGLGGDADPKGGESRHEQAESLIIRWLALNLAVEALPPFGRQDTALALLREGLASAAAKNDVVDIVADGMELFTLFSDIVRAFLDHLSNGFLLVIDVHHLCQVVFGVGDGLILIDGIISDFRDVFDDYEGSCYEIIEA